MNVKEKGEYKVKVKQVREGYVEVDAERLHRAECLAEKEVKQDSDDVEWEEESIESGPTFQMRR